MDVVYNGHHGPFPTEILLGMQASNGASLQAVENLDKFIKRFFVFDMPKNFFIQMAVAGSLIAILMLFCSNLILYRMYKGAFWVFKLQRRSEGTYIVPNALNSFLLFEGVFAMVWIAFIIIQYYAYWKENLAVQAHLAVFNLIIWWPLWIGAFMAGWGSFYTAPGALDKGPLSSTKLGKYSPRPLLINTFCLGTPIVLILSLLAPIILSQRQLNTSLAAYQSLHADMFSSFPPSQVIPPATARLFLQRASDVWEMQTEMARYLSIGYTLWSAWACVFLVSYIPAGGYLCYLVFKQLQRQRRVLREGEVKRGDIEALPVKEKEIVRTHEEPVENSLLFQPLTSSQEPPQTPPRRSSKQHSSPQPPASTEREKRASMGSSLLKDKDVFFPPLKRNKSKLAVLRLGAARNTPQSRYKHLRRCCLNITVLFVGIVLGAGLYLGVSAALARSLYSSYLYDSQDCTDLVYVSCVVTAWGAVLFGTLTVVAIFARFADPANVSSPGRGTALTKKKRHHPSTGQDDSRGGKRGGAAQTHDRTMPAVPESVFGHSRDDPLRSVLSSDSHPNTLRPKRSLTDALNFKLQQNKSGRMLILRPEESFLGGGGGGTQSAVSGMDVDDAGPRFGSSSVMKEPRGRKHMSDIADGDEISLGGLEMEMVGRDAPRSASKPLAPERSPPVSPTRARSTGRSSATAPIWMSPARPVPSLPSFDDEQQQSHAATSDHRRNSSGYSMDLYAAQQRSSRAHSVCDSLVSRLPRHKGRSSSLITGMPELISTSHYAGTGPPTPSTASSFPRTPKTATRALPDEYAGGYSASNWPPMPISEHPCAPAVLFDPVPLPRQHQQQQQKSLPLFSNDYSISAGPMIRTGSREASLHRRSPGIFF